MGLLLVFDTETSGFPDWKKPSTNANQPHIVSLGALLVDGDSLEIIDQFYEVSIQDGWNSDLGALGVHGITPEKSMEIGIPEKDVLDKFLDWAMGTGVMRVGYSLPFDDRIIRIAIKRFHNDSLAESYKTRHKFCCMQPCRSIVKATNYKTGGIRNPKLTEAYRFFTGKEYPNPHHALEDAKATFEVFKRLKQNHSDKVSELKEVLNKGENNA